jgi:hypothetical protein
LGIVASVAVTYSVVCVLWIFFRADNLAVAWDMLRQLIPVTGGKSDLPPYAWAFPAVLLFLHILIPRMGGVEFAERMGPRAFAVLFGATTALVLPWLPVATRPFIYFQF